MGGTPWARTGTAKYQSQASPLGEINRRPSVSGARGSKVQLFGTIALKGISISRASATAQAHATIKEMPATVPRRLKVRTLLLPCKTDEIANRPQAGSFP